MGVLEKESRKRTRKKDIQKAILGTVSAAVLLPVAICVPNSIKMLSSLGILPSRRQKEIISRARNRLVEQGMISKSKDGHLSITNEGTKMLEKLTRNNYTIIQQKRWDKKWRVLIFDIPENRKMLRDKVRNTLMEIGFKRLQYSVWIYPHDCEDLVALLKVEFRIGKELIYMIVESLENDKKFRGEFNLPLE